MKKAVLGLLLVNATVGLMAAAAFNAGQVASAAERGCTEKRVVAAPVRPSTPRPAVRSGHQTYLTAVRMGWAIS
jgi:hypothetical protein